MQQQKLESRQLIFKVFLEYHFDIIGHKLIYYNIKYEGNSLEITFDGKNVPLPTEKPAKNRQKDQESEIMEAVVFPVYFQPDEIKLNEDSINDFETGCSKETEFSKIRNIGRVESCSFSIVMFQSASRSFFQP